MATIKGLGYNATNVRNQTAASGDTIEVDGSITSAEGVTVTTGGLTVSAGGASITGNSSISGNLSVTGTLISQDEQQVLVKDNFMDLNFGYVGTSYEQTGLTFNYQATSSGVSIDTTSNNINFTAGTTTARAKVVADTVSGIPASTFAENDIIQINGTTNGDNDGIYVVHANGSAGTVEFKSDTLTVPDSVNAKFALLDVTTEEEATSTAVTIRKVNLMALRSSNAGVLESATGAVDSSFATYTSVGAGTVTLQNAYDNGQTITVDGDNLAIDSDGAGTRDFTIGSTNNFATFSADATSVTIEATGTSGSDLSLLFADNASASATIGYGATTQFAVTKTAVQISDDLSMNQAAGEQLISRAATGAAQDLKVAVTGNFDSSLILQGQGSGTDALKIFTSDNGGSIDIDSVAAITVDATTGLSLQGGAASDLTTGAGALTLDGAAGVNIAGNSSEIDITTTGALDINAGATTIDSSAGVSIDGAAASNFTVAGADLTLSTTTSGEIDITSAGLVDINAGANLDIDVTGTVDILASTTFSIDGTGASNVTATSGDLTLSTATSGTLILSSAAGATLDSTTLSIDSTDTTNLTMTANDAGAKTMTIAAINDGGGNGLLNLNSKTTIDFQIGGVSQAQIQNNIFDMGGSTKFQPDSTGGMQFDGAGVQITSFLDEDNMVSDSDTALATQQSIKAYVDSVAGASTIQLTANVNIDARDVVAIALTGGAAGQAIKADADSADTCQVIGFAEAAATATNTVTIRTSGNLTGFSGLTAGNKLYASTTAGGVTATAPSGSGDVIFQVGYARSATEVIIVPNYIMELG